MPEYPTVVSLSMPDPGPLQSKSPFRNRFKTYKFNLFRPKIKYILNKNDFYYL